ncbi:MAG: hypothetical protein BMS9Abin23_0976 [Thermodesulfobacteriota bacterium]|nr:MAG: hypothetical protein BMS9Abin23_0976 [Thermodesulfobacteriota bacterium]
MRYGRLTTIFFTLALLFAFSVVSYADVTVARFVKSSGINGMGGYTANEKEAIKGLVKRVDSKREFTGKFLRRFSGAREKTTIYDVANDRVVMLDHAKKTYTVRKISLPEDKEGDARDYGDDGEAAAGDKDDSEVKVIRNELKLKDRGEKKTINGFPCRLYELTWLIETENVKTGERGKSLMTSLIWTTPETKKIKALQSEAERFNAAYLKKMGLDMDPGEYKRMGLSVVGTLSGRDSGELKKELSRIKGYPITTSVKWEIDMTGKKTKEDEALTLDRGVEGLLGSLGRKVAKGKKKKEKKPVFESYVEIKSIDASTLPGSDFTVPDGYKEKKRLW